MTGAPVAGFGVPDGPRPPSRLLGVAAGFVYATAALSVMWAVVSLVGASGLVSGLLVDPATHAPSADTGGRFGLQVWLTLASASLSALILAVATAVAARSLTRGREMAYWWSVGLVAAQLAVLVLGVSGDGVQQHLVALTAETADYSADVEHVVANLPDWYAAYTLAHNAAGVLVGATALVLLFLPASLEHTARRTPPGAGGGEFEVPR